MRYRSDSIVSIDEPALQLGLNGEAVMEETVLEMLQTNNVEGLRKVDADCRGRSTCRGIRSGPLYLLLVLFARPRSTLIAQ